MANRDTFSGYHPIVNAVYFALVLGFTMFWMHPVCLAVSLASGISYYMYLKGRKAGVRGLLRMLPLLLITAFVNGAFNHKGVTILTYLPSGNPLTLESVAYGFAAGGMLFAVLLWFSCYTQVMTSDKFVYLSGRILPALSLVLSMTLRFIPQFGDRLRDVTEGQRCLGRDVSQGPILARWRTAVTILSATVTWALEHAVETADSMKSRGYGLPGRTAFSVFAFDGRDKAALCWLGACGICLVSGWMDGSFAWRYFPAMAFAAPDKQAVGLQLVYLALCLTPVILNVREDRIWKHLRSDI